MAEAAFTHFSHKQHLVELLYHSTAAFGWKTQYLRETVQTLGQLFMHRRVIFATNNCKFIYNRAFSKGGVLDVNSCSIHIAVCSFSGNTARDIGGVITTSSYGGGVIYSVVLTKIVLDGNLTEGSFQIANSIFNENSNRFFLHALKNSIITIINCTFIDTAKANWTLKLLRSVLYITGNTTLVNNTGGSIAVGLST